MIATLTALIISDLDLAPVLYLDPNHRQNDTTIHDHDQCHQQDSMIEESRVEIVIAWRVGDMGVDLEIVARRNISHPIVNIGMTGKEGSKNEGEPRIMITLKCTDKI